MTEPENKSATSGDWRTERLGQIRDLIKQSAPNAVEEQKWRMPSNPSGVPTWSDHGIICTGETYKDKVKLTFAKDASLDDPHGLFNASLDGATGFFTKHPEDRPGPLRAAIGLDLSVTHHERELRGNHWLRRFSQS